ncbi:16S rRNA (guanine(966)-N(2))-methyltransferase RsmD [Amnibacterium flavum]|uniref:16S rRNA (Guanine(966)-N(2))-methyltransferase RsmD n=1 Tax=Amnibacterium flavum TaxID=2173173 RepID=A0A2V1HW43_9MICO|nr:16S rRNA (guanine(966)-N(2))-methyltransferase RsmD [Amnibacterium flavum]PVZ96042.1 16S rRNA (guanine(966)-N(2))-methyltransferase RsmD [Amnibacterium flavum]
MRIISGFAGSLTLRVPRSGTRPTSDRTREGVFSSLDSRGASDGARVLDLYAGSGALGLEAVSRGATSAVLVDRASDAVAVCRQNAALVLRAAPKGDAPQVTVENRTAISFLERSRAFFDLVFIDPPYDIAETELTRLLELLVPRLAPDADIVLERSTRSPEPTWPAGIEVLRQRPYGETLVHFATTAAD